MARTTKRTILIVAIAVVLVVLLGAITQGFQSWKWEDIKDRMEPKRTPDNLITTIDLKSHRSPTSDIKIDVDDNGVVTMNGEAAADEDFIYASVNLSADTYTFTGAEDGGLSTYYLILKSGNKEVRADLGTPFSVDSTTTYQVIIRIKDGTSFKNVKIMPVLVKGDKAGDFYD